MRYYTFTYEASGRTHVERVSGWPEFDAQTTRSTHFGPSPLCTPLVLLGQGVFQDLRAQLSDDLVALLPRYYTPLHWPILQLAGAWGNQTEFVRLARRYPALPVLLLVHWRIEGLPVESWRADPFRHISFPRCLLRKIVARDCCSDTISRLRLRWDSLPRQAQKALVGCSAITHDTVRCLDLPAECITPALIKATECSLASEVFQAVTDILQCTDGEWRWANVSNPETLINLRLRLAELPEPPIAGSTGIAPLADAGAILEEARVMGHCLATYLDWIIGGRFYAYRVTMLERATLVLEQTDSGWDLHALVGPNNASVSEALRCHVHGWLGKEMP